VHPIKSVPVLLVYSMTDPPLVNKIPDTGKYAVLATAIELGIVPADVVIATGF